MDDVRVDVQGNLWCSGNAGSAAGYSGVTRLMSGQPVEPVLRSP